MNSESRSVPTTQLKAESCPRLFGPLEQLVAAVVILGLAMQAPPPFWTPPVLPPIIMNNTDLPPLALSPGPIPDRNLSTISTGNILLDRIYDHLPGWLQISPVNIALVLLVFNLGTMMMGDDLRKRLKESWDLFWPPWQDRRKVNSTSNSQVRFDNPESSSSNTSRKAELEKAREAKAPSADPSRSASADKTKGSEGATPDSKMVKNDDERPKEGSGLTESEKARKAKDLQSDKDRTIVEPVAKDKGKSRMEGERPGESNPASGSTPASSDKTDKTLKEPADSTSPRTLGDHESKDKAKDSSQSDTDNVTRNTSSSSRSTSGSGIDTEDDPLMSGDYRPLKSVLKKSKKKPKQSKNIHHNFFMTMRGYRPSLIPFPHGFHPKPQDPRNTLWWDNIQRSADHIMALPRVPKEPENKNEDEDKKEKKVGQEKGKGEDENKNTDKENKSKSTKSTSDEKNQGNASTNEKDKEKERAKSKAEAEAKAKVAAQKEAELKARAKAASGSSSQPDAVVRVPVDPKISDSEISSQKATYLSQGILSILLYYLNPQLGFLLLTFFAWQYINSYNDLILSLRGSDLTTSSSSSPSSSRTTNSNSATSSAPLPDQGRVSPEKPEKPSNNAAKIAELEKLIKKLKSLPEISPEHKEKLQRAMIKRKQLVDEDAAATREPHSEDESNTSPKKKDGEEVDHGKGEKREKVIFVIEKLEEKAKEMDDYVIKFRSIENPSEEQKSKLIKAEERRKALWKQVRTLKGNEPASMMPSTPRSEQEHANAKPQSKESREVDNLEKKARQLDEYVMKYRNIENPTYEQTAKLAIVDDRRKELWSQVRKLKGNEPTSFMPKSTDDKQQELNGKIKEIEMCIVKYKKLEDPSNDVKDKVIRAEAKRKALKKELLDLVEKTGGGSSGLTIDEKESLARPES
ncbi:hypothetical protein I204_00249 [Kwoniella mangroviensis CBS 8886]|nr:hypothetical protein I204_00249 [Kwoniella mangroviensis CBS 8886]